MLPLLYFLLFALTVSAIPSARYSLFDEHALLAFKDSLTVNSLQDWIPNEHTMCNWTGVTCSSRGMALEQRVVSLNLTGVGNRGHTFDPIPKFRKYDVFINHRGKDVKKTVASLIYHNLCGRNLNVFLDHKAIQHGHDIPLAITQAICTSSVHIAIFSRHCAKSTWCLRELCSMVESGAINHYPYLLESSTLRPPHRGKVVFQSFAKPSYPRDYGMLLENISACVIKEIQAKRQFQVKRILCEIFSNLHKQPRAIHY